MLAGCVGKLGWGGAADFLKTTPNPERLGGRVRLICSTAFWRVEAQNC
jgi:hypothetical protein